MKSLLTGTKPDTISGAYQDDTYDLLKKAIGAYNQGQGTFNSTTSWSELLLSQSYSSETSLVTAMKYAMEILQDSSRGIALPKRQYIWKGGEGVDSNKDGHIGDNPATEGIEGEGEKETPWCFAYGEEEWVAGKKYDDVKKVAKSEDKYGNSQIPKGRVQCS